MHKPPSCNNEVSNSYQLKAIEKPITCKAFYKLYDAVGKNYNWEDRHAINEDKLYEIINRPSTHIYTLMDNEQAVGYTEIAEENDYTEIMHFGLFPNNVGKGYGSIFLKKVIEKAWSLQPQWVQLNTCTLDHPRALDLYQKNGFKIVKTEKK